MTVYERCSLHWHQPVGAIQEVYLVTEMQRKYLEHEGMFMQFSIFFLGNVDAGWTWCMLMQDGTGVCCYWTLCVA